MKLLDSKVHKSRILTLRCFWFNSWHASSLEKHLRIGYFLFVGARWHQPEHLELTGPVKQDLFECYSAECDFDMLTQKACPENLPTTQFQMKIRNDYSPLYREEALKSFKSDVSTFISLICSPTNPISDRVSWTMSAPHSVCGVCFQVSNKSIKIISLFGQMAWLNWRR